MKKILLVISTLIFYFVMNEAKAQSENPCLALTMPHDVDKGGLIVNPHSVLEDTCSDSPTYGHRFANKGFYVDFSINIFFGELAPRGTIKTLDDIDSMNFLDTKEGFKLLWEQYGEFWFERNADTLAGSDTSPFFTMYFKHYIEVTEAEEWIRAISKVDNAVAPSIAGLVSVQTSNYIAEFNVFPNPTSEKITITFPHNNTFKTRTLTLRDITGREMFLKEIDAVQDSYTFSVQEIPSGVYMLEVRSGNEFFTKQVSVIR